MVKLSFEDLTRSRCENYLKDMLGKMIGFFDEVTRSESELFAVLTRALVRMIKVLSYVLSGLLRC